MAKKIRTYVVIDGCIQEGGAVFIKGSDYTPPTIALEKELLAAGVIALPDLDDADAQAAADAQAKAEADAQAKAEADAQAKAEGDLLNQGQ